MREGRVDDGKGMVNDDGVVRSMGRTEKLSPMREKTSLYVEEVVLIIAVGVVVLMVVVGVVVLMIMVGVLCIGAVEVDCPGLVDIFVLGRVFVVVAELGLVVRCVVRLVLWCLNGTEEFL